MGALAYLWGRLRSLARRREIRLRFGPGQARVGPTAKKNQWGLRVVGTGHRCVLRPLVGHGSSLTALPRRQNLRGETECYRG